MKMEKLKRSEWKTSGLLCLCVTTIWPKTFSNGKKAINRTSNEFYVQTMIRIGFLLLSWIPFATLHTILLSMCLQIFPLPHRCLCECELQTNCYRFLTANETCNFNIISNHTETILLYFALLLGNSCIKHIKDLVKSERNRKRKEFILFTFSRNPIMIASYKMDEICHKNENVCFYIHIYIGFGFHSSS